MNWPWVRINNQLFDCVPLDFNYQLHIHNCHFSISAGILKIGNCEYVIGNRTQAQGSLLLGPPAERSNAPSLSNEYRAFAICHCGTEAIVKSEDAGYSRQGDVELRTKRNRPPKPKMEGGEVTRQGAGTIVRCGQFLIGRLGNSLSEKMQKKLA
jgi:hypothetical protein